MDITSMKVLIYEKYMDNEITESERDVLLYSLSEKEDCITEGAGDRRYLEALAQNAEKMRSTIIDCDKKIEIAKKLVKNNPNNTAASDKLKKYTEERDDAVTAFNDKISKLRSSDPDTAEALKNYNTKALMDPNTSITSIVKKTKSKATDGINRATAANREYNKLKKEEKNIKEEKKSKGFLDILNKIKLHIAQKNKKKEGYSKKVERNAELENTKNRLIKEISDSAISKLNRDAADLEPAERVKLAKKSQAILDKKIAKINSAKTLPELKEYLKEIKTYTESTYDNYDEESTELRLSIYEAATDGTITETERDLLLKYIDM